MQNDIVTVKKPPASATSEEPSPDVVAEAAPAEKAVQEVVAKSSLPIAIIAAAIFVCLCLVAVAVYSSMHQA